MCALISELNFKHVKHRQIIRCAAFQPMWASLMRWKRLLFVVVVLFFKFLMMKFVSIFHSVNQINFLNQECLTNAVYVCFAIENRMMASQFLANNNSTLGFTCAEYISECICSINKSVTYICCFCCWWHWHCYCHCCCCWRVVVAMLFLLSRSLTRLT